MYKRHHFIISENCWGPVAGALKKLRDLIKFSKFPSAISKPSIDFVALIEQSLSGFMLLSTATYLESLNLLNVFYNNCFD